MEFSMRPAADGQTGAERREGLKPFAEALKGGRKVMARLDEPCRRLLAGTVVPVALMNPEQDPYLPRKMDGSLLDTVEQPKEARGYYIPATGCNVIFASGGGFWNPHTLIMGSEKE